ncbi:MAG: sugar phosphate isomerase/epimerase [Armatimonadetes bacterium]|nr:sugar phosphate isomerase/epimerase [Armatimonadota bacterium]
MRLAVQLFTLRDLLAEDVNKTLAGVSYSGFNFVETAGTCGLSVQEFASALEDNGLEAVATHVGLDAVEQNLDETAEEAMALGAEWIVVPWVPRDAYADGWAAFAERLGTASERVLAKGLQLAYHNHDFEFVEENGTPGYEILWDSAPETLEAELDVFWAHAAGHDPADWLRRLAGRVPLVHFKDGKGEQHVPVGEGDLDFVEIVKAARTVGVEWAIVELDHCPRDPLECVAASFDYLRSLGVEA